MDNNDILIDYNHLYNIALDKLLTVFPKSRTDFKFEDKYKEADLDTLESDDSYYWFKSFNFNHSDFIRHFLIREGIVEEFKENGNDTRMTDRGLKIVETGSFEKYTTIKERQEKLEQEIKETTLATNESVIKTNKLQRRALCVSMVVSLVTLAAFLYMGYISNEVAEKTQELMKQALTLQKEDFLFRQKLDSSSKVLKTNMLDSTNKQQKLHKEQVK